MTKLSVRHAPLAQLDRASGYGPEGREFESLRAYQNPRETLCFLRVLSCFRNLSDVRLFFDHGSDPYGKHFRKHQMDYLAYDI